MRSGDSLPKRRTDETDLENLLIGLWRYFPCMTALSIVKHFIPNNVSILVISQAMEGPRGRLDLLRAQVTEYRIVNTYRCLSILV